jgi:hypothetical protein
MMPMRRLLVVFAAIWLIAAAVQAQSGVAGKWTGEEQSAGAVPVVLQLTVNSSTVTGSVIVGENPAQAISEGKLDGKKLTFKTTTLLNGKEAPISWEAEVQDNELRFIRTFGAGGRKLPPIVLRRSK